MKIKTRPKQKKRMPKCPKCGGREFRKSGLVPTSTAGHSSKGWHGLHHPKYHQEAVDRLFHKKYVCKHCKTTIRYGNAGRPIT